MTSLDDAYNRSSAFDGRDPRRVYGGLAVVAVGVLALLGAILLVATQGHATDGKKWAGLFAGLGIPVLLGGVVIVLPASLRQRIGVLLGAVLTVFGTTLFWHAYPDMWTRTGNSMAFETIMVYALGGAIALWFVFTAIASTHVRNNPHGTVTLELVRQGKTKTVEVSRDRYNTLVSDGGDASDIIREIED